MDVSIPLFTAFSVAVITGCVSIRTQIVRLYRDYPDAWQEMNRPTGFFFQPVGNFDLEGLEATGKICARLLYSTPRPLREKSKLRSPIYVYRISNAICIVTFGLVIAHDVLQ